MAQTFSFEEAQKPLEPQTFSFEDAQKPLELKTFSFEDATSKTPASVPEESTLSPEFQQALEPVIDTAKPVVPSAPTISQVPTVRKEVEVGEATSNPFKGAVARASNLLGSGIEGLQRLTQSLGERMEGALTEEEKTGMDKMLKDKGPDIIKNLSKQKVFEPMQNWTASLRDYGKEINYESGFKLGDIADNPLTIVPFIAERVIASAPDMVAAAAITPAYLISLSNEILNERLKNDNKELKDATVSDVAIATGAAVVEATLERFATRGLLKPTAAKTGTGRVSKETAIQSGTEALEEGAGYLGGTAGTVKGVDYKELGQAMLEGAIVGGGLGASIQGGKEAYQVYKERAADNEYKEAMATVLADKGFSFAPPEVKQQIEQEATKSILESTKENLGNVVDSIKGRIAEFVAPKTPEADEFTTLVNRYRDSGLTYDEALNQAKQDFVEAGRGDQSIISGTDQSGVSVPSKPIEADTGTIDTTRGDLAAASKAATPVGGGEGAELNTLAADLKAKYPQLTDEQTLKNAEESLRQKKIADATKAGTDAVAYFEKKNALVSRMDELILKNENLIQEQDDLRNKGIDEGDKYKYQDAIDVARKKYEENGAEFDSIYNQIQQLKISPTTTTEVIPSAPPVKIGKPRGRPKAALTEAEVAVKTAERRAQQAAGKQVIRTAEKLQKISQEQFDPNKFKTIEDLAEGEKEFNERRRQALEDAYGLAVQGSTKENKAGTISQAILEAATPQERQLAKERYELRKKTARSELLEATDGNENTVYTGFRTAANALSWLTKNGNDFERTLAKRLMSFVRKMPVVIVRSPADLPTNYLRSQFEGAAGMYSDGIIYLAEDGGLNNTVFLHEALHGATIDRINKHLDDVEAGRQPEESLAKAVEQLNAVMKSAGRMYTALQTLGMTDARVDALARANAFTDIKEFIAYGMSNPAMQEFLLQSPGQISGIQSTIIDRLFTPFVQAIRKMFNMGENYDSAMQDLIIVTDKLLSAKFAPPKVTSSEAALAKKQSKNIDKDEEAIRLAKSSTEIEKLKGDMIKNHGFQGFLDLLEARQDALGNDFIAKLIYNLPTSDIVRWKGDEIPALVSTDKMMQEVSSMRMRLMTAVAKKAEALAKFTSKNGSEALSDTMHLARLKKVSPAKYPNAVEYAKNDPLVKKYNAVIADPNTDPTKLPAFKGQRTQRINQIEAVYAKWDALGKQKGGHDMYKMVQEYYQDMYNLTRRLLDDQINQLNIDAAAKAKLLKSVRMMHERSVSNKEVETVTLDDGTESIEATFASLPEDYFPFTRRGQYYLNVQGPKGREFYLFESGVDRNVFKAQRARELGVDKNDNKFFSQGDDIHALRGAFQDSSAMLKEMFEAIDDADTSKLAPSNVKNFTENLKDQLYQVYLMTMPERSFRKQFLHAEKITGFSSDILRNLKDSGTKYSNQLAKLKYGSALRNEIQRARDTLEGMPADERGRLEIFVNEMAARAEDEINPPEDSPWVNKINQISYLMLLTSAATAGVQMLAVPNMVMPTLNDQYGYGKSAAKLTKYMALWKSIGVTNVDPDTGETTFTAPSFVSSKIARENENLRRAYQYAIEKYNMFSLTNTSILTGSNKTPTAVGESALTRAGQTSFRLITALLNGSERISREITFGMSFELEFEKTGNFEESVQKAVTNTQELLGRYDAPQRPRSWRNAVGKTVLQFKTYSAFMSSWFLRNGYAVINKGLLDAEGFSAAHKLSQVILLGAMFHGLVGSPLYGVITSLIDMYDFLFGDEDELRRRRLKDPLTVYDSDMRFRYEFLPRNFGQIKIPGLDGRDHLLSEVLEKGPVSALTDMNIGSRTSYDGLWFREAKMGATTKETVMNFLAANLGPSISVGGNALSAIDDFGDGKIQRGLEKIAPAFFKAPLVAARLSREGAESQKGDMLLGRNELNNMNIAAQALGFQPTRLTRLQEGNFKVSQERQKALRDRSELLKELNEAVASGEPPEKFRNIFKGITKHNRRYPHEAYEIDEDTIERSLESYARRKDLVVRGLYIPEKEEDILMPKAGVLRPTK